MFSHRAILLEATSYIHVIRKLWESYLQEQAQILLQVLTATNTFILKHLFKYPITLMWRIGSSQQKLRFKLHTNFDQKLPLVVQLCGFSTVRRKKQSLYLQFLFLKFCLPFQSLFLSVSHTRNQNRIQSLAHAYSSSQFGNAATFKMYQQ